MPAQRLDEGLKGAVSFIADKQRIVTESLPGGITRTRIPGRISLCDTVNGNGRRYSKPVWEKNLAPGSILMQSIAKSAAFGLLEHPKDGQVNWNSPISHLLTDAKLQRGTDQNGKEIWEVVGEIQILDGPGFPDGQRLRTLIETTNYNPLVSTRGFGSLVRADDGVDDVQLDYVCEGADVVMKPSFDSAELKPQRVAANEAAKAPALDARDIDYVPLVEAAQQDDADKGLVELVETHGRTCNKMAHKLFKKPFAELDKEQQAEVERRIESYKFHNWQQKQYQQQPKFQPTLESGRGAQPSASGEATPVKPTPSQEKTMNLNEIKQAVATFKSTDQTKLPPQQFAEGMSQLSALHQEVANYVAEDAKRQWQGQQLHNEIAAVEQSWSESQLAPGKRATKLTEDLTKLMQVIKAVAQTGLTYKKKLGESVKQSGRQTALLNEVVERGQQWRQLAKQNESASAKYRRRFMMASEALQALAGKYKNDVVELGKRLIQLEFKEKAEAPEIAKLIKEATKPKEIVNIRKILEGKAILPAAAAAGAPAGQPGQQAAAPSLTEGKQQPAAPPAEGNPKAPVSEGVTILSPKPNDPRELNEAIGMVTRLSQATAQV